MNTSYLPHLGHALPGEAVSSPSISTETEFSQNQPADAAPIEQLDVPVVHHGRDQVFSERIEPLHSMLEAEEQEPLLIRLLFAARRLADECIAHSTCCDRAQCRICHRSAGHKVPAEIQHGRDCPVANVQRAIRDLERMSAQSRREREAADGGDAGRAGDGACPGWLAEQGCLRCGAHDDNWNAVTLGPEEVGRMSSNQYISGGIDGRGRFLYTHRCHKGGAQ